MRPILVMLARSLLFLAGAAAAAGCSRAGARPTAKDDDPLSPPFGRDATLTASARLAALRDTNRVLVVFAPNDHDARVQEQRRLVAEATAGFADRDLVLLLVEEDGSDRELARRFAIPAGSFAVLLIAKDGHQAFRSEQPVLPADLFVRIDAMPMRREELRRRGR